MNDQLNFASALSLALVHSVWELALIALLAALSFEMLVKASARWRHTVGMIWLSLMLALPILTFALCWQLRPIQEQIDLLNSVQASNAQWLPLTAQVQAMQREAATEPWIDWVLVVVAQCWLLGVLVMLCVQLGGWRVLRKVETLSHEPLPPHWQSHVERMARAMGVMRTVLYRVGDQVVTPFTAHVLRPIVWIPLGMLTRLTPEQLEALLAHELAHIQRLDWLWNGWQCVIEAFLFFHPGMWWLSQRIRQEREHACDDIAVVVCGDAIALAEALTQLERQRQAASSPRLALGAQGGSLMKRISHLLSGAPIRQNWRAPTALLLLLCSGSLLAMQINPPQHLLSNLLVNSSSSGELTPGNFREMTATYLLDKQRYYRISMDEKGRVEEIYKVDGKPMPVDAKVRSWVAAMTPMSSIAVPPIQPVPPVPPASPALAAPPVPAAPVAPPEAPAIPAIEAPPAPPASPSPPSILQEAEIKILLNSIESDPRLITVTGQPLHAEIDSFHGSLHSWGAYDFHLWGIDEPVGSAAKFTMSFTGPKGRALVGFDGKTKHGKWNTASLVVKPLATN